MTMVLMHGCTGTDKPAVAQRLTTVMLGTRVQYVNVTAQSSNDVKFGGDLLATGNITAYSSDRRLKENIKTIDNALDMACRLRGVTFDWRDDCEERGFVPEMKTETGFIAQELQEVIPDAVVPAPFDQGEDGSISGENYLTVNPEKVIPVLIEAIKELKAEVEELKNALQTSGAISLNDIHIEAGGSSGQHALLTMPIFVR